MRLWRRSVSAIYGLGDPDLYLKMMLHLTVGMIIDQRAILRRLDAICLAIKHSSVVLSVSSWRGLISSGRPDDIALRVELFDEEVERLSLFDPLTGQIVSTYLTFYHLPENALRHATRAHRPGDERSKKSWPPDVKCY